MVSSSHMPPGSEESLKGTVGNYLTRKYCSYAERKVHRGHVKPGGTGTEWDKDTLSPASAMLCLPAPRLCRCLLNPGALNWPDVSRSFGERNGNALQYSYLGHPMDRGAWQAIVHEAAE